MSNENEDETQQAPQPCKSLPTWLANTIMLGSGLLLGSAGLAGYFQPGPAYERGVRDGRAAQLQSMLDLPRPQIAPVPEGKQLVLTMGAGGVLVSLPGEVILHPQSKTGVKVDIVDAPVVKAAQPATTAAVTTRTDAEEPAFPPADKSDKP